MFTKYIFNEIILKLTKLTIEINYSNLRMSPHICHNRLKACNKWKEDIRLVRFATEIFINIRKEKYIKPRKQPKNKYNFCLTQDGSDVTFDTRLRSLYQKNETSHIEALYRSLIRLRKARDLWRPKLRSPENHVTASVSGSNEANLFLFILIYILGSNELCPWNNSLRTEAELTLTDHRFNSWVCLIYLNYFSGSTPTQMNDFDNGHYFYAIN